ncbi:WhiB family transcriptional regulator [Mycolicibacterium holsaticum]|uniref:WhiB family transcriptional regulator n=1 Tax=Mycolicibacterium holsaticum TaxID=152142 RepID=UPI000A002D3A|nr:WhiB family transcriptional regulator [Mycolicibacterium holsaticum]
MQNRERVGPLPLGVVSLPGSAPTGGKTTEDIPLGLCTRDPDRWTITADEGAKAVCRACPRRWRCAQQACETPAAEGIWAGILIPESGRARRFALRQLRSLAELNGYPVRHRRDAVEHSA